ncbi:hypothetical protein GIB67_042323 [Kingdonia uniflora]|uniref:K+ potassium transporter integral membrane domain-containing protein n=1 Tax=Kingdonia uniflora TaxID=39325 RepID=A0A7J7LEE2_9MAGN|nr:hypothetical protein GIB67_042323 [Kingdonia uniflora]
MILAYQSLGVVYGDLSTSPLYLYTSTFVGKLQHYQNEEAIFGAFSLIFWTLTLMPLLKYVIIVLSADDNGEGGTFAFYSLLCRHVKLSLLPNQQAADEELSTYNKRTFVIGYCVVTSLACIILVGLFAAAVWFKVLPHLWISYFLKAYNELVVFPILESVKLMA